MGAAVLAAGAVVVAVFAAGAGAAAGAGVVAVLAGGGGVVVFEVLDVEVVVPFAPVVLVDVEVEEVVPPAAVFAFFLVVLVVEEVVEPDAGVVVVGVVCARTIPVQSRELRASTCSDFIFRSNPFQFLFVDWCGAANWDDCLERLQEPPVVSHIRCKHRQVHPDDGNQDALESSEKYINRARLEALLHSAPS